MDERWMTVNGVKKVRGVQCCHATSIDVRHMLGASQTYPPNSQTMFSSHVTQHSILTSVVHFVMICFLFCFSFVFVFVFCLVFSSLSSFAFSLSVSVCLSVRPVYNLYAKYSSYKSVLLSRKSPMDLKLDFWECSLHTLPWE